MIFLDMDGVIADFVSAALEVHGQQELQASWPRGEYSMSKVLGITQDEFWRPLEALGADFWISLPQMPDFDEILQMVDAVGPWMILSAPYCAGSAAGKLQWLRDRFGTSFSDYLFTPPHHKRLLSHHPRAVLIDDSTTNVEEFSVVGKGVLYPQVWNANHRYKRPLAFVRRNLLKMLSKSDCSQVD